MATALDREDIIDGLRELIAELRAVNMVEPIVAEGSIRAPEPLDPPVF